MNTKLKSIAQRFVSVLGISLATIVFSTATAHAEWFFGIGTGLSGTNIDGKQGFNTVAGPVTYDVSLSPGDFNDLTKSAFGFGGYATNGTWMIQYSLANIELEDEDSAVVGANTVAAKINFKMSGGEVTVGYPVYKSPSVVMFLDAGVRYTKHEFDNSLTVSGAINTQLSKSFSHDWTDGILGVTLNVPLSKEWSWGTRFNAGFGGSEHAYFASTGVTWRFHKSWSAGANVKYVSVKYENGSQGDSDWYLYDADESSVGLSILYNW